MQTTIASVLIHVSDVKAGIAWYQRAFPDARRERLESYCLEFLVIGDVRLEIVGTDNKVASGAAGSIVYWRVPDFESALAHFQQAGATLYRGPIPIENGEAPTSTLSCRLRLH